MKSDRELADIAIEAMKNSYSPYSDFKVGAALLCRDGTVFTGCNIENAAFSSTVCAERTAFFKAVSDGKREFSAIAVVGGKKGTVDGFCPPCGVCRQVMNEFCGEDFKIILFNGKDIKGFTIGDLLPESFGAKKLCE